MSEGKWAQRADSLAKRIRDAAAAPAPATPATPTQPPDFPAQAAQRAQQSTAPLGAAKKIQQQNASPRRARFSGSLGTLAQAMGMSPTTPAPQPPQTPGTPSLHSSRPSTPAAPHQPPQSPPDPEALRPQIEDALGKISAGTPLHEVATSLLISLGVAPSTAGNLPQAMQDIDAKIAELKAALNAPGVTDAERDAFAQAFTHGGALPGSPALEHASDILRDIHAKLNAVQAPPALKGYDPGMIARPVTEVGGSAVEGGLATLVIASAVKAVTGVSLTTTTLGHLLTWGASAVVWNLGVHSSFKAITLQEVANRGKIGAGFVGLLKHPKGKGWVSSRLVTTPLRVASMALLMGGGVEVVQKIFGTVDDSARHAQMLSEPLLKQKDEFDELTKRLKNFAPIMPKILEIAQRIEAGKGGEVVPVNQSQMEALKKQVADAQNNFDEAKKTGKKQTIAAAQRALKAAKDALEVGTNPAKKGAQEKGAVYSIAEKTAMKQELVPLFEAAGIDPQAIESLTFADPKNLGQGPIFEFKRALRTGDVSNMRELRPEDLAKLQALFPDAKNTPDMVIAIRTKMGLEPHKTYDQRIAEIIRTFIESKEMTFLNENLERSLEIAGRIGAQGNDVLGTSQRAFLEGDPPISIEEVLPYNKAIIDGKETIRAAMRKEVAEPINAMFATLSQALGQIGGEVELVQMPEATLDTQYLEDLQKLIEQMVAQNAAAAARDTAIQSSLTKTLAQFVPGAPGSEKAHGMERYVARMMAMYVGGYQVKVKGNETVLYKLRHAGEAGSFNAEVASLWDSYVWRDAHLNDARALFPQIKLDEISAMKDPELGKTFRAPLEGWLKLTQDPDRAKDVQLAAVMQSYQSLLRYDDEKLGSLIREQGVAQLKSQHAPIIYAPVIWEKIVKGIPPPKAVIDLASWAREASQADPTFGASFLKDISGQDDATVGKSVQQHVTSIIENLEKKIQSGAKDAVLTQMVSKYKPLAATPNERLSELGGKIRKQLAHEIEKGMSPVAIYPDSEWELLLNPALAQVATTEISPESWEALPPEKSKGIFDSYLTQAEWQAAIFAVAPVLFLSMGSFLFSILAVRRKNSNLLKVADQNIELWKQAEKEILDAIADFNAILGTLPFFSELPKLDPYMLLAALRKVGEEYEDDLKQDLSTWENFNHHARATIAPGPYAEPVAEIFAMERMLERLRTDKKAQQKLADIIAPGFYELVALSEKVRATPHSGTGALDDFLAYQATLGLDGRELFRNAARGHLRFRSNVLKVRTVLNERAEGTLSKSPAMSELRTALGGGRSVKDLAIQPLPQAADTLLSQLVAINSESLVMDTEQESYDAILDRLDNDALAEKMLKRYEEPSGRTADILSQAEDEEKIQVPAIGEKLKEFSLVSGIQRSVDENVLSAARQGKKLAEIGNALCGSYEAAHPGETCDMKVSVDADGEVTLSATVTRTNGTHENIDVPVTVIARGFNNMSEAVDDFVATIEGA